MDNPRVLQGTYEEMETMERKIASMLRLSVEERYALYEDFLRFVAEVNPGLMKRHAHHPGLSVRVVRLPPE